MADHMLFMTVPTAGSHPELLRALIDDSGLPRERIIVVTTRIDIDLPDGVVRVDDLDLPPNIQRWWRRGIDEAQSRGATAVVVANDDLQVRPETFRELHAALIHTGATIASPSRPEFPDGLHKGDLIPYEPRIWGCLWMVDVASGLRPDERYVWWYGDNDLDIRARRDYNGIVSVPVWYEHLHPGEGTSKSSELVAQSNRDAQRFETDYADLLRRSRRRVRWQRRIDTLFRRRQA